MRKVTQQATSAFIAGRSGAFGNTHTDTSGLYLHGNKIAERRKDGLYVTNAGWATTTTKERLNGIPGVRIHQKDGCWYLNGERWDGSWTKIQ